MQPTGLMLALLIATLALACFFDWRSRRIPNALVAVSLCTAIAIASLTRANVSLGQCLSGAGVALLFLLPFYALRALGAGDVKLMAAVGGMLGVSGILWSIFYTGVAGGVMGIAVLIWVDGLRQAGVKLELFFRTRSLSILRPGALDAVPGRTVRLPYAFAIAAGVAMYVVLGPPI